MTHAITPTGALLPMDAARDLFRLAPGADPTAAGLVRLGRVDGVTAVRWRAGRLTPPQADRLADALATAPGPVRLAVLAGGWMEETVADGAAAAARLSALAALPAGAPAYRSRGVRAAVTGPVAAAVAWARSTRGRADDDAIGRFLGLGLGPRATVLRLAPRRERGAEPLELGRIAHVGADVRAAGDAWRAAARGRTLPHVYPDLAYLRRAWADMPAALASGAPLLSHVDVTVTGRAAPRRLRLERFAVALDTGDGGRLVLSLTALCPATCSVPLVG